MEEWWFRALYCRFITTTIVLFAIHKDCCGMAAVVKPHRMCELILLLLVPATFIPQILLSFLVQSRIVIAAGFPHQNVGT